MGLISHYKITNIFDWEYDPPNYSDFVIDCLNENYYSLSEGFVLLDFLDDELLVNNYQIKMENIKKNLSRIQNNNYNDIRLKEYYKRVDIVKDELLKINLTKYKRIINLIFIENEFNSSLSAIQKYGAYCLAYGYNPTPLDFDTHISIESDLENLDSIDKLHHRAIELNNLGGKDKNKYIIYQEICKYIIASKEKYFMYGSYSFSSFSDVFKFLLSEMIKNNCKIKICNNCGKYFVPIKRSNTLYCNNVSPQDDTKTCGEYRKYIDYLKRTQNDEATKLYKQIYNKRANKVRRGGTIFNKTHLYNFTEQARQWKTEIKAKRKTKEEYIAWLKEEKNK